MKYQKKPVVIDAVQFTGVNSNGEATFSEPAPKWLKNALALDDGTQGSVEVGKGWNPPMLMVHTLEGVHRANVDDFIIRGIKGELYPCKPDIFAGSYQPAS